MAKKAFRLGDLQLRIMQVLWENGPQDVAAVQEGLGPQSDLAYTTIATMLRKMEARGLVHHEQAGRKFIYQAAVRCEDVTKSMAEDIVDRLFEGSLSGMVSHLLNVRDISPDELDALEQLIAERKQQQ